MSARNTLSATVGYQPLTEPERDMLAVYRLDAAPFWSQHSDLAALAEDACREAIEDARQATVDERLEAWLSENADSAEAAMWRDFERSRRAA